MEIKKFLPFDRGLKKELPVSFSVGMLMDTQKVRPIYRVMLAFISLAALYGSFFTFISASQKRSGFEFDRTAAGRTIVICWAVFSLIYGISGLKPALSRTLQTVSCCGVLALWLFNFNKIIYGIKYFANLFMASLFIKYESIPMYEIEPDFKGTPPEECTALALFSVILLSSLIVCRTVKTPNLLLFICATFPLPELCLYFGLVPDYKAFAVLCAAWCAAAAAEVTRLNMFSDKGSEKIFTKTGAQSGTAALVIMLMSILGAFIYADVINFERSSSADSFRKGFVVYMKDFSWKKLKDDITDAVSPPRDKKMTHDGRLGNVENVQFSGKNMLEVTLPSDAKSVYLKGFTGTYYTGGKWEKGEPLPALETNLTSPEFFSARVLKYFPDFADLPAKDVIVRSAGTSSNVKYYPANAAGLLETDGTRRRFGVYFPKRNDWQSVVMNFAGYVELSGTMRSDELRMRDYAYNYCLDVPETFEADADFFKGFYRGSDTEDTLKYIRKELAKRCKYTLESGKKPFGTDFAQWFLTESKAGSCTHFATAAVLLCRTRGIPARYCEGFVIKPEDIKSFESVDGYTTVSVPDNRAHAWAEVYIDGYGWLVFESTPGYGNMAFDAGNIPDNWENAPASEITAVTTEAPDITEIITSEATTVTETAQDAEMTGTALTTTFSAAPEAVMGEGASVEGGLPEALTTPENTAANENIGSGGGNGGGNGGGSETSSDTVTTVTASGNPEITPPQQKKFKLPEAVKDMLIFFGIAGGLFGLAVIRRSAILSSRKKLLENDPDAAAAKIYRLLIAASGAKNDPARLPDSLEPMGIDRECTETIISTAEKARFGRGIEKSEALRAAEALSAALETIKETGGSLKTVVGWFRVTDRFI